MTETQLQQRLKKFLSMERITNSEFGRLTGTSASYVNSVKTSISFAMLEKIQNINPQLNWSWLIFGTGAMYRGESAELETVKRENIALREKVSLLQKIVDLYAKNEKSQTVTIPKNILMYMLDLEIYNHPSDFYIIGKKFMPCASPTTVQALRRRWQEIREKLALPVSYQFYSLKDSGITKMISLLDVAEVRDQARHHNISITDVYTDRTRKDGNDKIKRLDFEPGVK